GFLGSAIKKNMHKSMPRQGRILLANLPWQRDGMWGVRAGSRWPHIKNESEKDYLPFPFFLAYAAALLKKHSIEADLIDAIADQIPENKFLEIISENNYGYLVAETSIPSFAEDLMLLERISDLGVKIILCGPNYEIYDPQFMERYPFIDFVLYGEYEFSLLELIQNLLKKNDLAEVKGLIYRDGDRVIKTPKRAAFDINLLPWPHREGLSIYKYLDAPGGMLTPNVQMLASRGCPFGCQFCLWPQVIYQGRHYRVRDVVDVADEMEYLVKEMGFKSVYFDDDTFNIGKERILEFCGEIRKRGLDKVQWGIMARPDLMDEELLRNLKGAGLYSVKYGVESAAQKLVDSIDKGMDLKKAERMIRLTKKLGIKPHLTFAFGLPGETKETIEQTIRWAKKLDPFSVQFSIATPFPGTKYYDVLKEKGLIVSNDHSSYDGNLKCVVKTQTLEPSDLENYKQRAYNIWFEHIRKKRGFLGDVKRFFYYANSKGFTFARAKALDYLRFVLFKKNKLLKGVDFKTLRKSKIAAGLKKLKNSWPSDILFIQCPPWDAAMPPLGIAYLSSNLRKAGYKTSVLDLNIMLYNSVEQVSEFLWDQKSSDLWNDAEAFKDTWRRLKEATENIIGMAFKERKYRYIALSSSFTGVNFCKELISIIR
ncbi:radical SAM protein, partial [bacterium]